ncbi:hypothetical protein RJ55_01726 [Drechmeria coniospora]|nr:hypothetical protein RJ55_01726 [Drechmeria coniospora]
MSYSRADRDGDNGSLLSPIAYDDDASSLHSRSAQDTDSDDDQLQKAARNSRELRAHDRIVLMEEEETDRLVTRSRRQQEREKRSPVLTVPNPFNVFGRMPSRSPSRSPSASPSRGPAAGGSTEDMRTAEKRASRRQRRRERRERLFDEARDGEDGGLMYELEEGGMKEGSSTGDSSEGGADADRRQLRLSTQTRGNAGRSWRRWVLIHSLLAIGFAILVLGAWKMSRKHKGRKEPTASAAGLVSNGTALFAPTTIIVSLDGFRADFLRRGITPRLNAFVREGVSPKYMLPSFPSVTFPNHYTLATGLYPESHGVVGNTFWDPDLAAEFYYTDPLRRMDPKWWAGEPFWVTAELQGIRTAVHMWPGSEAHIMGVEPSLLDKYNGKEKLENKVSRVLEFLDLPGEEAEGESAADESKGKARRPRLIAAYVPDVDSDGHKHGPNSTEIGSTIARVDAMMDRLFKGLDERNLTGIVNVIVVSDHGMATTDVSRLLQLEDLVDTSKIAHTDGWPLYGLRPKDDADLPSLHDGLKAKAAANPNFDVYLRDVDMPERYHFSRNSRIAPLWIVPKTGWAIVTKSEFDVEEGKRKGLVYHPRGLHGYDHEHPLMRAIFIARGPAFPHPANSEIEPFQNINVYNILADSVGMVPQANNGTLRLPLKAVGTHKPGEEIEVPDDPPAAATEADTTTSTIESVTEVTMSAKTTSTSNATTTTAALPSGHPERPVRPEKPVNDRPTLPEKPVDDRPTLPEQAVNDRPSLPGKPVNVDRPVVPSRPTSNGTQKADEGQGRKGDDGVGAAVGSAVGSAVGKVKKLWVWLKDTVGHAWNKMAGGD